MVLRDDPSDAALKEFLGHIQLLRPQIEKIILFGSRARGDDKPYSDYDILIVVPKREQPLVDRLYEAVMQVLFSTGKDISLG